MKRQNSDNLVYLLGMVCGHHGRLLEDGEDIYERERILVATIPSDCGWEGIIQRFYQSDPFNREMILLALIFLSDQKEISRRLNDSFSPLLYPQ